METQAFIQCRDELKKFLDVSTIQPQLLSSGLLTYDESVELDNLNTNPEKVNYLLDIMPFTKTDGWLDIFIECLKETTKGSDHGKIVKALETVKEELMSKDKGYTCLRI